MGLFAADPYTATVGGFCYFFDEGSGHMIDPSQNTADAISSRTVCQPLSESVTAEFVTLGDCIFSNRSSKVHYVYDQLQYACPWCYYSEKTITASYCHTLLMPRGITFKE